MPCPWMVWGVVTRLHVRWCRCLFFSHNFHKRSGEREEKRREEKRVAPCVHALPLGDHDRGQIVTRHDVHVVIAEGGGHLVLGRSLHDRIGVTCSFLCAILFSVMLVRLFVECEINRNLRRRRRRRPRSRPGGCARLVRVQCGVAL